ncbi:unnamed protein product [Symbiodinium pilosum]|uniref:Uncharacterized protein n=1 Tax=Symbiodinium pilosum TaxID=2952 RepID=A0A812VUA3_SYMPI|nr:unnamed protein product [Symbiodinium pilosum]
MLGEEKYKPEEPSADPTSSTDVAVVQKPRRLKKAATRARLEERSTSPRPPEADKEPTVPTTEVRPCDCCGEMRKTTNFSRGDETQWLCAACQLTNGGLAFGARQKQKRLNVTAALKPQPVFKRQNSDKLLRSKLSAASDDENSENASNAGRARRRGRCKTNNNDTGLASNSNSLAPPDADGGTPQRRAKLMRANTANLGGIDKRSNVSSEGSQALEAKELLTSVKEPKAGEHRKKVPDKPATAELSDGEGVKVPPLPQRTLPGGYTVGERAVTLISREAQNQTLLMELGQEGNIVGAVERRFGAEVDLRLLVQFPKGVCWWLSPFQISQPAQFGAARAAGIFGFSWGCRVKSLITLLNPPSQQPHQELWLGDEGTVVGPSVVKGKLAVRFDNGIGEWSIWPCLICKTEAYEEAVQEKILGFARGDRVRCLGQVFGSRSFDETRLAVADGEEGTIVGPGHASGKAIPCNSNNAFLPPCTVGGGCQGI